jgi:hypothetical protein
VHVKHDHVARVAELARKLRKALLAPRGGDDLRAHLEV